MTEPAPDAYAPRPAERGLSPVSRLERRGPRVLGLLALALLAGGLVILLWDKGPPPATKVLGPVERRVDFQAAPRAAAQPTRDLPQPDKARLGRAPTPAPALSAVRPGRAARQGFVWSSPISAKAPPTPIPAPVSPLLTRDAAPVEGLAGRLSPGAVRTLKAERLGDLRWRLLAGRLLPCVLETAIDSTLPGLVACVIPVDIWSEDGSVVLLDKGARVLGEYAGRLGPGDRRLFVTWTRAATPSGVVVDLASPAADALGRTGFDGEVEARLGARFGAAIAFSLIEETSSALDDGDQRRWRAASPAAAEALRDGRRVSPVIHKPAGAVVSIFLAHDLDFSGVYGLALSR